MTNKSHDASIPLLFIDVFCMAVYISEAILILTGNLITIYIFWNIRKRLKRTSYLLINLAVADIFVGIAITLAIYVGTAVMTLDSLGLTASISSLALISLEKMFAILWPFRHRMLNTWLYHISAGCIWCIASLNGYVTLQFDLYHAKTKSYFRFLMSFTEITSVLVITGAYLAIWNSTRRNRLPSNHARAMEQNRNLAKTLFTVTALSVITYLPNSIYSSFEKYLHNLYSFGVQTTIAIQYSNSFLNPVIYSLKIPAFRRKLQRLFCRCPGEPNFAINKKRSATSRGITLMSVKAIGNF